MSVRRLPEVDTDPLPMRRDRGYGPELCLAGCGNPARYQGYCYQHWRQADGARRRRRSFQRIVAAVKSDRDAARQLGSESVSQQRKRCAELGIEMPAPRLSRQGREAAAAHQGPRRNQR